MSTEDAPDARRAAELAARASYGRLVAYLARRSRDVAAAEDALGDAFVAALATWPRAGVADKPEAWLLAVARRRLLDAGRHVTVAARALPTLHAVVDEAEGLLDDDDAGVVPGLVRRCQISRDVGAAAGQRDDAALDAAGVGDETRYVRHGAPPS